MSENIMDALCLWKQAYQNELEKYGEKDPELDGYLKLGCDSCLGLDVGCKSYSSIYKLEKIK